MFQPPCSKTFPLRPTAKILPNRQLNSLRQTTAYTKASPYCFLALARCLSGHSTKNSKTSLAIVTSGLRFASLRLLLRDSQARLAACQPKAHPLFKPASSSPFAVGGPASASLQHAASEGKTRHQTATSSSSLEPASRKNSRLAPKGSAGCVASYSCLAASRALPVLPAAPPRHRPGVSTQSSDLHTDTILPPHSLSRPGIA